MVKYFWLIMLVAALGTQAKAQDYVGPSSIGSQEPLFSYDDQERWKHGYLQIMPYYHGHHSFLPYNYHHVLGQSQVAAAWGMSPNMPYSQQFWHRYEGMANSSGQPYSSTAPVMNSQSQQHWAQYPPAMHLQQPVQIQPPVAPQVSPVQFQTPNSADHNGWGRAPALPAQPMTPVQQYLIQGPALP